MPKKTILVLLCFIWNLSQAQFQPISENAEVSLLTCGTGNEIYSLFGHSAIRVSDPSRNIDWVFNYGMFNFNTPNFTMKFVRGKLQYHMGVETFKDFQYTYHRTERWIYEQQLNLNQEEKEGVYAYLVDNLREEKRYYQYDFFYDNCSSRLRDVLQTNLRNDLVFAPTAGDSSFRDYIDPYIKKHPWIDFGMDVMLGYQADVIAKDGQELFLPVKLMHGFSTAKVRGVPLVKSENWVFNPKTEKTYSGNMSPTLLSFSILALVLIMTIQPTRFKKFISVIDALLQVLVGLMGLLFLFMWLFTDHETTYANLNMLWASPLYLILLALLAFKKKEGVVVKYLYIIITVGTCISLVFGAFFPQELHFSMYPLMMALLIRLFPVVRKYRKEVPIEAAN